MIIRAPFRQEKSTKKSEQGRKHVRPGNLPRVPHPRPLTQPATQARKGALGAGAEAQNRREAIGTPSRPIRLLLVDDQPAVLRSLRMNFECEEGLQIVGEAEDGEAALALAQQLDPDLVLMDAQLPVISGIEATAALKNRCTVVILTMYDDEKTRASAMQAGATAFVGKSEPVERLVATIREAARRRQDGR